MKHTTLFVAAALLSACGGGDAATTPNSHGPDAGLDAAAQASDGGHADAASSVTVLVTPSTTTVAVGRQVVFSAAVSGTADAAVAWSVTEGSAGGSVDASGLYTAPATAGTYHVVARSHADSTASGVATVVVTSVGSCSALPAPGTWDATSIAPVVFSDPNSGGFTGDTVTVTVDPFDPATVWLGTGYKGLFESGDCGATWKKVNTGTNGGAIDQSVLWSTVVDPVNRGVIYTVGAYGGGGLWKSSNGGVDWEQLFPTSSAFYEVLPNWFVGNVSMDPSNPLHLVVASHGTCNAPFTSGCFAETTDGGTTWGNFVQMPADWAEQGGVQVVNATTWVWGTGQAEEGTWVTTDNGKTWKQVLAPNAGDTNGEFTMQPLARASDGAYYTSSLEGVVRSTDGVAWSLVWAPKNNATPQTMGIASSPTTIYASRDTRFYSAPIGDYTNWSPMPGPPSFTGFAGFLGYDPTYHVLYASTWQGGLYRYVTN
jgi:hypothetical protein